MDTWCVGGDSCFGEVCRHLGKRGVVEVDGPLV